MTFRAICLILCLFVGFLGVHLYQQDKYRISTERALIPVSNKQLCDPVIRFFKYNRTFTALNFTTRLKINLGHDIKAGVQVYKFMSNEYRFFPITLTIDICKAFDEDLFGLQNFLLCGNVNKCPINKGFLEICNWGPDFNKFPPHIPAGQYRVDLAFKHGSEALFTLEWYAKLEYPQQF